MKKFVKNLFSKKSTKPTRQARQLRVEMLEDRTVLDASSRLGAAGFIIVDGTNLADYARVIQQGDKVWVYTSTDILPGAWRSYEANQVQGIAFHGNDGHDIFYNETSIKSYMYLGEGNDTFFSGHGDDVVLCGGGNDYGTGGLGNDSIRGEGGDDYLRGFMGNDTICGNDGWDELHGEWGNDLLFGGAGGVAGDIHQTHDYLYGGDGRDVLEAGANTGSYPDYMVSTDVLYGNDSERAAYSDAFILSNGRYASNGDFSGYDRVEDARAEDVIHGFGRLRSGEAEYQSMTRIPGVLAGFLEQEELGMLPEELEFFVPEIDPMEMIGIDHVLFDGIVPEELLESANTGYFTEDPDLAEVGPELEELVSILELVDEEEPLDYVEVIDLPISMFEEAAVLDEADLVTMTELEAVSLEEAAPLEITEAALAPVTTFSYASSAATKVASYKIKMW